MIQLIIDSIYLKWRTPMFLSIIAASKIRAGKLLLNLVLLITKVLSSNPAEQTGNWVPIIYKFASRQKELAWLRGEGRDETGLFGFSLSTAAH